MKRSLGDSLIKLGPVAVLLATLGVLASVWRSEPPREGEDDAADAEATALGLASLVVDFRDDVSSEALASNDLIEEPVSRFSARDRLYRVRFASPQEAARAAERLRGDPTVESVGWDAEARLPPDEAFRRFDDGGEVGSSRPADASASAGLAECAREDADAGGFPNDTCYRFQWHLGQVGLPGAWKLGQGEGVVVAVIDTGVSKVPDLAGTPFVPGYNFVADNEDATDDHGHGTHVAGTIAQSTHNRLGVAGVAFKASIMPLKVLSARGSGSMAAIAQAIRFAADNGAKVINMSLGGPMPVGPIKNAIRYARDKGVVVVAAAGNNGQGRVSYPAKYPGVIAVAATQFDESTTFYSNFGKEIDIAAPGGNVRVDQNGDGKPDGVLQNTVVPGNTSQTDYLWFMGTSMASPHVAGVAALVVGAGVTAPDAVEAILTSSARKPKAQASGEGRGAGQGSRVDDHYGAGIVDADAALKKARLGGGASRLAVALSLFVVGAAGLGRRARLGRLGLGLPAGLVIGACGLFFLPALVSLPAGLATLTVGVTELVPAAFGVGAGSPLLLSAALPLAAVALLYGVARARPLLGGLAFGVAGALAFGAVAGLVDVAWIPDLLDRAWLAANAVVCYALGVASLKK